MTELAAARAAGELFWLQNCSDNLLFTYMAHALALIYPSLAEGFGFPPLEAMALGTPVLCGDTPALRELVDGAGLLCDPTDLEALAHGTARIAGDTELRCSLAERGRRRAGEFTWGGCARAHERLYREVLA